MADRPDPALGRLTLARVYSRSDVPRRELPDGVFGPGLLSLGSRGGATRDDLAIVRPHELDDEGPHLRMLCPGRVGNVGRPDGRLTRGDSRPVLIDTDPATALDDDEPRRVRARVRLDPCAPREGELGDRSAAIRCDDLSGQPDRPDRAFRASMTDPETSDLDRHGLRCGDAGWSASAPAALAASLAAAALALLDRGV